MFGKINKFARSLLTQVNPVTEFQHSCSNVLRIMRSGTIEEIPTFVKSLNHIIVALQKERQEQDCRYLNFVTENQILRKIADGITDNLKSEHVKPLLTFWLEFLSPSLINLLHQVAVHSALAAVLCKLDFLNRKCESETLEFVENLWRKMEEDPIQFELLAVQKGDGRCFPILDYFVATAFSTSTNGRVCRSIIEKLMMRQTELGRLYSHYLKQKLFPRFTELLISVSGYAQTVAFRGIMTAFMEWFDNIITYTPDFDIGNIFSFVETKLSPYKRLLAMAFFVSTFHSETVHKAAVQFCVTEKMMSEIVESCRSDHDDLVRAAIALISQLIKCKEIAAEILPPKCDKGAHILSIIPVEWLMESEGDAAQAAYSRSAAILREVYGDDGRMDGKNSQIYDALLFILSRFSVLSLPTCLALTRVISLFHTVAPDLINEDLASVLSTVVAEFEGVVPAPSINVNVPATPEVRARILAEFAKEVNGTYVSSNA